MTPEEVLALLRGVSHEADLERRFHQWRTAATNPADARFAVKGTLGRGSQGTVWAVADRDFLRQVAVKTMHERDRLPEDVSRFIHEAQITAQLEHPGIVPVHDLQVMADGTAFYVMKRIEGKTLAELLPKPEELLGDNGDQRRLALIDILLKVLDTLAFAHSRGVIHRDVKPKNIMVGSFGEVLVLDWGLAKIVGAADDTPRHGPVVLSLRSLGEDGGSANATGDGCAVGTPAFMSPEQALGRPADARSDVFAVGVILYHVLAGMSPFDVSGGARLVLEQVANGVWTPLADRRAARALPRRLLAIAHKAMASAPEVRYQSAAELATDLRQFLAGEAVAAYQESPLDHLVRLVDRHRRVLLTGVIAACGVAAAWAVMDHRQAEEHRQTVARLRTEADRAFLREDWDEARGRYERILSLEPADLQAQSTLIQVKLQLARRTDQEVQRRKEAEAQDVGNRARRLVAQGGDADLDEAERSYLKALGLNPQDHELLQEYAALTKMLAIRDRHRRDEQLAADRRAEATKLRARSQDEETQRQWRKAIGSLEGAASLEWRQEDMLHLNELLNRAKQEDDERVARERRGQADKLLDRVRELVVSGAGRAARERLEQIKGLDATHPTLLELEPLVQAAERREREANALEALRRAKHDVEQAEQAKTHTQELDTERRRLSDALAESSTPEARRALQQVEQRLEASRLERARHLAAGLAGLHRARAEVEDFLPVRAALADFYVERLRESEADGLVDEAAAALEQARQFDDGSRASLLAGEAVVVVPATAHAVILTRLERDEQRLLAPVASTAQTVAAGQQRTVVAGRWLASSGDTQMALAIARGDRVELDLPACTLPAGVALIPSSARMPAFGLMVHEVTCGDYLLFLNDPAVRQDIDIARAAGRLIRMPRQSYNSLDSLWRTRSSNLRSSGGGVVEGSDGRSIDMASPIRNISAEDAVAYAQWRSRREHLRWRLPTLAEWRRAAQGGDGRLYPWGEAVDVGLCASALSCRDMPTDVVPPVGSFPHDRSVQGVEDLAGSVSEFVDGGDEATVSKLGVRLVPLMGGNRYDLQPERFSAMQRRDMDPLYVHAGAGFRLALDP